LPYWQVNVPPSQREATCPPFLANLSAKDLAIISTLDASYRTITWPEVRQIIAENRIDTFQRVPSDLRRYLAYNWMLKKEYGSIMEFVLSQRLGWKEPIRAEGKPFEKDSDIKILFNDWPYGIDKKIVHLVIWTKFELEDDPLTDDLTAKARKEIDDFVDEMFGRKVGRDNVSHVINILSFLMLIISQVIWFKNWRSLKSVHAVEHFHVMLYDADPAFVEEITNGDVPLSQKV
jgi:hypothetical protein